MKKRFVTLFPNAENVHLTKDVGMIPFILHKYYGYSATLVCYKNGEYPALENEVKGLEVIYLKRVFDIQFLDSLWFIFRNHRKYDILNMYHWVMPHQIICLTFKILKLGKCLTYIKMDAGTEVLEMKGFKLWILEKTLALVNLVSVETKGFYNFFKNNTNLKIEYIPNGFYDNNERVDIDFNEKENVILTVGRIGTKQKATEVLLEGFKQFAKNNLNWKLKIVGPIEPDFDTYIQNYFKINPLLRELVEIVGSIYDKKKLNELYRSAKIFALTSRWESFGLVYVEALQAGCYIVSTNIPPAHDVTGNKKYGNLFPIDDVNQFVDCLKSATNDNNLLVQNCNASQQFAYHNFYWPKIVSRLDNLLQSAILN